MIISRILTGLAIASLFLLCYSAMARDVGKSTGFESIEILQQAMRKIQKSSKIPVAIPQKMPSYISEDSKLYVSNGTIKKDFYAISLDSEKDCAYSDCQLISFLSSEKEIKYDDAIKDNIVLNNGDHGFFYEPSCGANCTSGQISWKHNRFYYVIDSGLPLNDLLQIANSMIYGKPATAKPKR
jgi:hypothetical protein